LGCRRRKMERSERSTTTKREKMKYYHVIIKRREEWRGIKRWDEKACKNLKRRHNQTPFGRKKGDKYGLFKKSKGPT